MILQKRDLHRIVLCMLTFCFWENSVSSQVKLTSPRPISDISRLLAKKYHAPISYEDTQYNSTIDIVRSARASTRDTSSPQNFNLREQSVNLESQRAAVTIKGDEYLAELNRYIVRFNQTKGYEAFAIIRDAFGIHIVSYNALDKDDRLVHITPILDTKISLSFKETSALSILSAIENELRRRNVRLILANIPLNALSMPITINLVNGSVRQAVEEILKSTNYKGTWQLLCGPLDDVCGLNISSY